MPAQPRACALQPEKAPEQEACALQLESNPLLAATQENSLLATEKTQHSQN